MLTKEKGPVWQDHREQVIEEDEREVVGAHTPGSCLAIVKTLDFNLS